MRLALAALALLCACTDHGATACDTVLGVDEGEISLEVHDPRGESAVDLVSLVIQPNSAPSCAITAPEDGASGEDGALVTFRGEVGDVDVPSDWLDVRWSGDRDGGLADSTPDSGGQVALSTSDLSVATHTIPMVASNAWSTITSFPVDHGNNGSCTVSEDGWLCMADHVTTTFYRLPLY